MSTTKFLVQDAGKPVLTLVEHYDDTLTSGQIINKTRLAVKLPNPNYTGDYRVAHFEISLQDPSGRVILDPTFVSGNIPGKTIYEKIDKLEPDSKILFTQVILTYPDGGYHKYKEIVLQKK